MLTQSQSTHVLEHKKLWLQFGDNTNKVMDQTVSGIVKGTLSNHAEALTRRATENDVYVPLTDR